MAGDLTETGGLYSPLVGMIFVFNLIVGTGALTMPHAFDAAGWALSLIVVVLLAFTSYLTVTFMVESMAAANALRRWRRLELLKQGVVNGNQEDLGAYSEVRADGPAERPGLHSGLGEHTSDVMTTAEELNSAGETSPLLSHGYNNGPYVDVQTPHYYDITERIEMGQMASMFFNKAGMAMFHICMAVYLYGDLAIYAAAVPKSMRDVACTHKLVGVNGTECNTSLTDSDLCWDSATLTRMDAYRIFLAVFCVCLGSFVFFNVQKTMILQVFTSVMRWLAFAMMIILACIRLARHEGEGDPVVADIAGLPTLFGVCVYSFMCHHSLPSLTTPIRNKSKLLTLFATDYSLILGFYCLISFTGIFAFKDLKDLYTLNFLHNDCDSGEPITTVAFIQYFLALFPVFTLSTNFPIIGITLRNNLKTLFLRENRVYHWSVDRLAFPLLTLIPPLIVAMVTNEVDFLVSITGSYAGAAIQYVIPAALVLMARRETAAVISSDIHNKHRSPFKHGFWVIGVFLWAILCISFVTVHHIVAGK